jgi:RNA polymerase I-specific transcription initiation factor RRN3
VCAACLYVPCALQAIQLVPALPTRLLPMLVQNIPHKLRDRSSQCLFLRAVILLAEGKVRCCLSFTYIHV